MKTTFVLRLAAFALAVPCAAQAADASLTLLRSDTDQIPERLVRAKVAAPATLDRAPASYAWAHDGGALASAAPFVRESREYWFEADAKALRAGVAVRTTAPGSVLRLSPVIDDGKAARQGLDVTLSRDGRALSGEEAFASKANAAQLNATGASFSEGTVALVLNDALGAGKYTLAAPNADRAWLVHVYEPRSVEVLSLTTSRSVVLDGHELQVIARFASGSGKALGSVRGIYAAPGGEPVELAFEAQADGSHVAKAAPRALDAAADGLWEIHTFAVSADGSVRRDATTAFDAVAPTARIAGKAMRVAPVQGQALGLRFGVEVASASRYAVGGVLYATDAGGKLVPAAIAHAAAWLEPGAGSLELAWPADALAKRGLRAPYEVRELTLTNQASLGVIERRERAVLVD
jgi:hypothetical protein